MTKFEHIGHPAPGRQCEIHTVDGHYYEAVWVERINKYVDCKRWRRTDSGISNKNRWVDDKDVIEWREL